MHTNHRSLWQAEAKKQERKAKRRSSTMSRMALGDGMASSLNDMSNELIHGLNPDSSPQEKMQTVMINAKQRGLTVNQIFKFFLGDGGDDDDDAAASEEALDVELEPAQFGDALKRLGPGIFDVRRHSLAPRSRQLHRALRPRPSAE